MAGINDRFKGECKFLITYNNCEYIKSLADKYGFYTYVQPRINNMTQGVRPGEMFEELLIANYDLEAQAEANKKILLDERSQLTLFDFHYDY